MRKCIDMLLRLGVDMTAVTIRAIRLPWLPDSNAALKTTGELIGLNTLLDTENWSIERRYEYWP